MALRETLSGCQRSLGGIFRLLAVSLGVVAALPGCGSSVQAGLSNASGVNRQSRPKRQHDAIANGPEACASNIGAPAPSTNPACQGRTETEARVGAGR